MKYTAILAGLLLLITACSDTITSASEGLVEDARKIAHEDLETATSEAQETAFIARYAGAINGEFAIQMKLINWGNGDLIGNYFYNSVGKTIELNGEIDDDRHFRLEEYVDDKPTGSFTGVLRRDNIQGKWQNRDSTKVYPFELERVQDTLEDKGWAGNYYINDIWDDGHLIIGNVGEETFDFALSVFRNGHFALTDGTATLDDNKAYFQRQEISEEPCQLTFERYKSTILLEQNSSTMACGFGMRASVDAAYEPQRRKLKPRLNYGNEGEIFENQKLHDAFKAAVGVTNYELFAFNMQLVDKIDLHPQDDFTATVKTGRVAGSGPYNQSIILSNRRGDFGRLLPIWKMTRKLSAILPMWRTTDKNYRIPSKRGGRMLKIIRLSL